MRRVLASSIAAVIAAALLVAPAAFGRGRPTVRVGVTTSLTGSGAAYGKPAAAGMRVAAAATRHGRGARVRLDVRDDGSAVAPALAATNALLDARVDALFAPTLSPVAQQAGPLAQRGGVPFMGVTTTTLDLEAIGSVAYRVALTENTLAPASIRAAHRRGVRTVAIVFDSRDGYSAGAASVYRAAAEAAGMNVLVSADVATAGADKAVTLANSTRADALLLIVRSNAAVEAVRSASALRPRPQMVGGNGYNAADVLAAAGNATNGLIVAGPWNPQIDTTASRRFVRRFRQTNGDTPDAQAALGAATVELMSAAGRRGGAPFQLLKALRAGDATATVLGRVRFDSKHNARYRPVVQQARNGRLLLLHR